MSIIRPRTPSPALRRLILVIVACASVALPSRASAEDEPSGGNRVGARPTRGDGWRAKDAAAGGAEESAAPGTSPTARPSAAANDGGADGAADGASKPKAQGRSAERAETPSKQRDSMTPITGGARSSLAAERAAVEKVSAKTTIDEILTATLPSRSDRPVDWRAGPEALHRCGDPRWVEPCIPPPPCHPSLPPHPLDLVGIAGDPTSGPIYRGPCCPRTGTHDDGPLPGLHRFHDRLFDAFYRSK